MNSVPLVDALPWENDRPPNHGSTILVTDSLETDGRFILQILACQYLSSKEQSNGGNYNNNNRVVWVSCDATNERQLVTALKKFGCDSRNLPSQTSLLSQTEKEDHLHWKFLSVPQIISSTISEHTDSTDILESCAKTVHSQIRDFSLSASLAAKQGEPLTKCGTLVVFDNVSSLVESLGEVLTYAVIQRVRGMLRSNGCGCLVMRISNELQDISGELTTMLTQERRTLCVGFGGEQESISSVSSFENGLMVELADGIIDVLPLQSGFSNEAHGRIAVTERMGGLGWSEFNQISTEMLPRVVGINNPKPLKKTVFNFLHSDFQVKAIHLRSKS